MIVDLDQIDCNKLAVSLYDIAAAYPGKVPYDKLPPQAAEYWGRLAVACVLVLHKERPHSPEMCPCGQKLKQACDDGPNTWCLSGTDVDKRLRIKVIPARPPSQ